MKSLAQEEIRDWKSGIFSTRKIKGKFREKEKNLTDLFPIQESGSLLLHIHFFFSSYKYPLEFIFRASLNVV